METRTAEMTTKLTNERRNCRLRMTDLITVAILLAIIFAHYFLPPLIEVLVFIGLLNMLISAVLAKQSKKLD